MADHVDRFAIYCHNKGAIDTLTTLLDAAAIVPDLGIMIEAMRHMRDKLKAEQAAMIKENSGG